MTLFPEGGLKRTSSSPAACGVRSSSVALSGGVLAALPEKKNSRANDINKTVDNLSNPDLISIRFSVGDCLYYNTRETAAGRKKKLERVRIKYGETD
jgi:hypothetical protein